MTNLQLLVNDLKHRTEQLLFVYFVDGADKTGLYLNIVKLRFQRLHLAHLDREG